MRKLKNKRSEALAELMNSNDSFATAPPALLAHVINRGAAKPESHVAGFALAEFS